MSICNDSNSAILSVDQPASLAWGMGRGVPGSLDGIILRPGGSSYWKAQPNNVPLKKGRFFVPMGTPLPLKCEEMYQTIPENSMMVFAQNVASPLCKSDYSTMGGQICTTPNQRSFIGERRGDNKNFPNYSF
jgi:hypothetical protein